MAMIELRTQFVFVQALQLKHWLCAVNIANLRCFGGKMNSETSAFYIRCQINFSLLQMKGVAHEITRITTHREVPYLPACLYFDGGLRGTGNFDVWISSFHHRQEQCPSGGIWSRRLSCGHKRNALGGENHHKTLGAGEIGNGEGHLPRRDWVA